MSTTPQQLDILEILKILPHRYPFLMVDRILELEAGERITGYKNVTMNENFFQGHFPSQPVMPGVLILEGMAQVGAILAYQTDPEAVADKLVYFAGIDGVKFRQKVVPGDQLHYEISVTKRKSRFWKMAGKAFVDGKLAAEAELMATFG
ncbi:MAG: 3-hydroxyacyl-ACP dehydratase FabZ [Desulfobulbaceae bacterium]|nr:3-hydroxyacyl-ACP dehydratase FabZ [Desulfobulbaceae bacterium]HIJ79305.1 3-hydroxyacyl-ACP dehydratase FabZ [Deltaproteobacteria bacterium]